MNQQEPSLQSLGAKHRIADACGLKESNTLTPSVQYFLESAIKKHRDDAFRLESLLRELPCMSHEATRALWDIMVASTKP